MTDPAAEPPSTIALERPRPGVAVLSLDNPSRRNALDPELAQELRDAVAAVSRDRTVRALVITGRGPAFCSGADLGSLREEGGGDTLTRRDQLAAFYRVFLDVRDLAIPTIAAVNGAAVGAGLNLSLCCDMRIAGTSARFGATFVRLGIHPGGGASYLLTRLIGPAAAAEMLLLGNLIDAQRALSMGLVNRVIQDQDLLATSVNMAEQVAGNAPAVARAIKRTLRASEGASFQMTLELEANVQAFTQDSAEAAEGWAAFRERRAPQFPD